jgi:hypothetical protein
MFISKIKNKYLRGFVYYLLFSLTIYLSCLIILGSKAWLPRKSEGGGELFEKTLGKMLSEDVLKDMVKKASPKEKKEAKVVLNGYRLIQRYLVRGDQSLRAYIGFQDTIKHCYAFPLYWPLALQYTFNAFDKTAMPSILCGDVMEAVIEVLVHEI